MPTPPAGEQDLSRRLHDVEAMLDDVQAMLDAITDYAIVKLDLAGNVARWSRGAQALHGYSADEVLGRPVSTFYTDEDRAAGLADRELATARESGRFEFEGWRVRKDGQRFRAGVVLTPIRDKAGAITSFAKVVRDLTAEYRQAETLRRQRDEIMELSTPVIQVWDKVLTLPVIGTLDSTRAARLTEGLLVKIAETEAEVVIFDISGVPTVDTYVAQHLLRTVRAAALMGTVSIMCGVRPETAQAMVRLGIDLGQLRSRRTLRQALQLALTLLTEHADAAAGDTETIGPAGTG